MKDNRFAIYLGRTKLLLSIFIIILVISTGRFFYLQVIKGTELRDLREQNINDFEYIYPKRGRILSREGIVLAEDRKVYSIAIDLEQKPSEKSIQAFSNIFSDRTSFEEIKLKVEDSLKFRRSEVVLTKIGQEELAKFLVRGEDLTGFSIIEDYERQYDPHPSFFHVLGHMGYLTESDAAHFSTRINDYDSKLWRKVGKSGIERVYENELQGKHGKKFFQRNARGDRRVITGEEPFSEGNEIIISIDYEAQKLAYELMQGNKGSIVVIDLKDFSIPVAVSTPSISANDLRGISSSQYQELLNDSSRPLFNRAFMGLYPPGSSIKPLFATFAISNSYTTWDETIFDDGFFRFEEEQRVFNAWKEGGHGYTDLNKALVESSNPFFMNLSVKYEKSKFVELLKSSSFGSKLCEDCYPHQYSPLIDDAWKRKNFGKDLFKGDFINLGIGQGYMLTTPLHLSLIAGMLASKGQYKLPYLVRNNELDFSIDVEIQEADWVKLNQALIDVVYSSNGTGYKIEAGNLNLAGKSGTAQVVDINSREEYDEVRKNINLRDHAIFIGYAPFDDPRYSIAVIVENGESGGRVAGPIARDVLRELLNDI
uniref:Penicillin-binding protein 2 n=1 Tax=uncultured gamma proteobacterium HF0130_23I23 TaxID=710984 RepID=E0XTD8_9GAMM|nr:cell division protein ftsi/penicillin-binding protein 2 [uncultured gamma proteobacterium HF0130_23I23]